MNAYIIELYKPGSYEETKKTFVVESTDRSLAARKVRQAFGMEELNAFAGKKISKKAADKLVVEGATDMR